MKLFRTFCVFAIFYTTFSQNEDFIVKNRKNIAKNEKISENTGKFQTLELFKKGYLSEIEVKKSKKTENYAWQTNINYIQPLYLRSFVREFVVAHSIEKWPNCLRYLVFPQIYGYFSTNFLKPEIEKVYKDFKEEKRENSRENEEKVDLLEKLVKLEELKKEIERNLIDQTEKLLEGKKYEERIDRLARYLQEKTEKISKIDEMLEEVAK